MPRSGQSKDAGPRLTDEGIEAGIAEETSGPEVGVESQSLKRRSGRASKSLPAHVPQGSNTPTLASHHTDVSYSNLSFQQAQEKLMDDIISHQEDPKDEIPAFGDFINLPPRHLTDYYQAIRKPVSLRQLQRSVKGTRGKNDTPGVSNFKSWSALEDEFSFIWKNTFEYNLEDSVIYGRAQELKSFFYKTFREAKEAAPEPAGPKIKLKLPNTDPTPKITLKFGGKTSPSNSPTPQASGPSSSGPTLNGTSRKHLLDEHATSTPIIDQPESLRSVPGPVASPSPLNATPAASEEIRNIPHAGSPVHFPGSKAMSTPGPSGSGMPPPSTPAADQHVQSKSAQSSSQNPQLHTPSLDLSSITWREPSQTASNAIITGVSVITHPGLNLPTHLHLSFDASSARTQQSFTIHLPSTHYYLQIKPTLDASLLHRQHKLWARYGDQSLPAMAMIPGHPVDPLHPLFETRLEPGNNSIEIHLVATLPPGAPVPTSGVDAVLETFTLNAFLLQTP